MATTAQGTGKCPKCEKSITSYVTYEDVTLKANLGDPTEVIGTIASMDGPVMMNGFMFLCPHCETILGVQVNPR